MSWQFSFFTKNVTVAEGERGLLLPFLFYFSLNSLIVLSLIFPISFDPHIYSFYFQFVSQNHRISFIFLYFSLNSQIPLFYYRFSLTLTKIWYFWSNFSLSIFPFSFHQISNQTPSKSLDKSKNILMKRHKKNSRSIQK